MIAWWWLVPLAMISWLVGFWFAVALEQRERIVRGEHRERKFR